MLLGVGPDGPIAGRRVAVTGLGAVSCCGIGLHSALPVGMTLRPAGTDSGLVFVRTDLKQTRKQFGQPRRTVIPSSEAVEAMADVIVDTAASHGSEGRNGHTLCVGTFLGTYDINDGLWIVRKLKEKGELGWRRKLRC